MRTIRPAITKGLLAIVAVSTGGLGAAPAAAAMCVTQPMVFYAEFPVGSAEPPMEQFVNFHVDVVTATRGAMEFEEVDLLAMGDIAEGPAWEAASAEARAADRRLGEARLEALKKLVPWFSASIPETAVNGRVRETREVITAEAIESNPGLTERTNGAIRLRPRRPPPAPGMPVPVC